MALYAFSRQKVDWAVIETGMGGRYDATNVIQPAITVITNVSMEHREYLGRTLAEIAREKAGIIKSRTPLVTAVRQNEARSIVRRTAAKHSAPVYILGKHFKTRQNRSGEFCYYGLEHTWPHLQTALLGTYQVENAALALAACELLIKDRFTIPLESIKEGLKKIRWPGRLEIISDNPMIILDGAHNLIAARKLAKFLKHHLGGRRITLVVGILDDKPFGAMLKSLLPVCHRVIITRAKIDRALDPRRLYSKAQKFNSNVSIVATVPDAFRQAVETASADEVICVAGSLYVVGEAKEAIQKGLIRLAYKRKSL